MAADLVLDPLAPPKNCPQCARVGIKSKVKKMKVGPTSADLVIMCKNEKVNYKSNMSLFFLDNYFKCPWPFSVRSPSEVTVSKKDLPVLADNLSETAKKLDLQQLFKIKKYPAWLKSVPLYAEPVIMLQGDDPDCHVSFPVPLLVAISPLVRNILSDDHLPPAFSTPVISIPSLSVDILESVREILVSGMASMDMTRLCGVRELFRMIGIEDRMVLSVDTVGEEVCRKMEDYLDISENLMNLEECVEDDQTDGAVHNLSKKDNDGNVGCDDLETDVLKTLVGIKSEEHVQDCSCQIKSEIANIEILVKLEKVENPVFLLHHDEQSSHQFDEESQILSTQEELLKTSNSVAKQVKVSMARLKHADSPEECIDDLTVDENQDKSEKEVSFSPSSHKGSRQNKKTVKFRNLAEIADPPPSPSEVRTPYFDS